MAMRSSDVRRWIAGFEAAAAADRRAMRLDGPDESTSIRLGLSLISAARRAGWRPGNPDPLRDRDDEAVRQTWALLRRRLAR
jgi:hypothetical protein